MQATMMDYPLTLAGVLEHAARSYPCTELISRRPDGSLYRSNYAALGCNARALASSLRRAGMREGDRVATLMWNHQPHLEASFGIPMAGCVFHPLNFRLHPGELGFLARHAEDRLLIVDETLLPLYEQFRDEVEFERIFVASLSGRAAPENYESYDSLIEDTDEAPALPRLDENAGAVMCSTSGTTARPKSVVYSHRALIFRALATAAPNSFGISHDDTVLMVVPMFHLAAWNFPYLAALCGSRQVLPGPHLDPQSLLGLIQDERVTFSSGVPTVWQGLLDLLEAEPDRQESVRGLRGIVGGAAPSETMLRTFDRHGMQVNHGWAMTETFPGTFAVPKPSMRDWSDEQLYELRVKQGMAGPFYDLRAVNEHGVVPWDGATPGELQVRSPSTASSYYKMPEEREQWTDDGWFRTGDVVTIDEEGFIKIVDRAKDLVKSGGEWISSVDVENALMGHPDVREAAVIGISHPRWQERPLAVIVSRDGAPIETGVLRQHLAKRFAKWQIPDAFVFIDEIPHTSTGKMAKSVLRTRYEDWNWD